MNLQTKNVKSFINVFSARSDDVDHVLSGCQNPNSLSHNHTHVQEQTSKLLETSAIQNKAEYQHGEDEVIRINNQNEAQLQSKKNIVRRCGLVFYVSLTALEVPIRM